MAKIKPRKVSPDMESGVMAISSAINAANGRAISGTVLTINKSGLPQLSNRPKVRAKAGYSMKNPDVSSRVKETTGKVVKNQSSAFKLLEDM